mgnify:FL=1
MTEQELVFAKGEECVAYVNRFRDLWYPTGLRWCGEVDGIPMGFDGKGVWAEVGNQKGYVAELSLMNKFAVTPLIHKIENKLREVRAAKIQLSLPELKGP